MDAGERFLREEVGGRDLDDISVDTQDGDRSFASHEYDDESIDSEDETDIYGNPREGLCIGTARNGGLQPILEDFAVRTSDGLVSLVSSSNPTKKNGYNTHGFRESPTRRSTLDIGGALNPRKYTSIYPVSAVTKEDYQAWGEEYQFKRGNRPSTARDMKMSANVSPMSHLAVKTKSPTKTMMPLQVDQHQEMSEARNEQPTAVENVLRGIGDELAGEALSGVVETSVQAQCALYRDTAERVANRLSETPPTAAGDARIEATTTPTAGNLDALDGAAADLPGGDLSAGADISAVADVPAALGGGGGVDIAVAGADCDCGGCFLVDMAAHGMAHNLPASKVSLAIVMLRVQGFEKRSLRETAQEEAKSNRIRPCEATAKIENHLGIFLVRVDHRLKTPIVIFGVTLTMGAT
ncbi:hypothetical protein THAOC_03127 [Thalassiosira oceanica]|uniref:Uncharacterized protein n=1 Tax=Thalassiosira oceanica TaxID=159749 RepID=K0TPZ6_THAOC|nr:hypothetical protein THAOC_03127 [Thalassiosira oceanica]|eukprot:EJK75162.1 hypothetical protein THAOC_03127 [Thalassiosira oceanica]